MTSVATPITDTVRQIDIVYRQEGTYLCHDYMSPEHRLALDLSQANVSSSTIDSNTFAHSIKSSGIDEEWRQQICEWTFQVIDHFDLHREIAVISLNYLDRYLSKRSVNRKTSQLVAMTSLFLAIKLYGGIKLRMSSFIELSRGCFKIAHIAAMESSILWTLSWHLHPPTPLTFVRHFIRLLEESECAPAVVNVIMEEAQFLTELSACNYYFTTHKPSSIGLGSILAAIERSDEITLPMRTRFTFLNLVRSTKVLDPFADEVEDCCSYLSATYAQYASEALTQRGSHSPDCVADISFSELPQVTPQVK